MWLEFPPRDDCILYKTNARNDKELRSYESIVNKSKELVLSAGASSSTSGVFILKEEDIVRITLKRDPSIALKMRYSSH